MNIRKVGRESEKLEISDFIHFFIPSPYFSMAPIDYTTYLCFSLICNGRPSSPRSKKKILNILTNTIYTVNCLFFHYSFFRKIEK